MGRPSLNSEISRKLIEESIQLTKDISALDKKREADLTKEYGALVVWYDRNIENSVALSLVSDKAIGIVKEKVGFTTVDDVAEKSLEQILIGILRLSGVVVRAGSRLAQGVGVAAGILLSSSGGTGGLNGAYLDDGRGSELEKKQFRLAQIYTELFLLDPPLAPILQPDICAIQA